MGQQLLMDLQARWLSGRRYKRGALAMVLNGRSAEEPAGEAGLCSSSPVRLSVGEECKPAL